MSQTFQQSFTEFVHNKFQATKGIPIAETMISSEILSHPKEILEQARLVARLCYKLRDSALFQSEILKSAEPIFRFPPKNFSLFMSYDFHLVGSQLKLVEINTNAAFSAIAFELYEFQRLNDPLQNNYLSSLKNAFETESELSLGTRTPAHTAIVDENLIQQKMFVEFVVLSSHLENWGWKNSIGEISDLHGETLSLRKQPVSFVYNRSTNFSLNGLDDLKRAYTSSRVGLSPNPHEYFLLAEKSRLIDLTNVEFLLKCGLSQTEADQLTTHLPFTKDVKTLSREEVWALRKKVFFKPKRAYAGKEVYKGESITRKVYEQILSGDFIAQELLPPPLKTIKLPNGDTQDFKYDLRFYAYRDQIQLCTARLYQGQVTNFRAPGSGFAPVLFS